MTIKNKTINLYTEWKPLIDGLSDEQAGKLLKDIFNYQSGEQVENSNPVWLFIKAKIDEYNQNGSIISKARSEAGKKGMMKRWGVTNDNKCYQMITTDNKNNNKIKENKIKEKEYISDFEEFWKEYPKQRAGSKDKAYTSYCRVIKEKRATVELLLESVKQYAQSEEVDKGFAKGCAAWLNDDRFNNQYKVEQTYTIDRSGDFLQAEKTKELLEQQIRDKWGC